MAYSKTDWTNNVSPYINATNLNKMETGIDEAHDAIENTSTGHDHDGTDSKKVDIASLDEVDKQSFTNLLENGDFESWSSGASAAPDGWTIEAGTIARESTTKKRGTYSLKITTAASTIRQILPLTTFSDSTGKAIFGMWVKSDSNSTHITLHIDGSGGVVTYHSGSGSWEFITVTKTLNAGTNLEVSLYSHDTVNCYIDGAILVEGSVCPAFSPKPLIDDGIMLQSNTPSAANDYGKAGQWCYDANYIYVCTATDTWLRAAIATW